MQRGYGNQASSFSGVTANTGKTSSSNDFGKNKDKRSPDRRNEIKKKVSRVQEESSSVADSELIPDTYHGNSYLTKNASNDLYGN